MKKVFIFLCLFSSLCHSEEEVTQIHKDKFQSQALKAEKQGDYELVILSYLESIVIHKNRKSLEALKAYIEKMEKQGLIGGEYLTDNNKLVEVLGSYGASKLYVMLIQKNEKTGYEEILEIGRNRKHCKTSHLDI